MRTRAELTREVARLKAANAQLAEEVRTLREDPARIEAIARDELGLVRPGEMTYDFRPAREATAETP
jgi:cell division protein FtsB